MGNDIDAASVTSRGLVSGDNILKHSLLLLIIQIVIIICFSRAISFLFRPLRQPRVIAEIVGGILLGPTLIGRIPGFTNAIFPPSSIITLQTVSEFGLIFFLFLVGLELDLNTVKKSGISVVSMAAAGISLPFLLGVPVSLVAFRVLGLKDDGVQFGLPFIIFVCTSLSITAFPILARILTERKILYTEIGQLALSAAAVNDVVAWTLLALAVAVTNSGSSPLVVLWVILLGAFYITFMFTIVRPFMNVLARRDPLPEIVIVITLLMVLISALATDAIGIHVIFGAFIMGLIIPKDQPLAGVLVEKIEDFVTILFLPLFFTSSGLKTNLNSLNSLKGVGVLLLVLCTAITGKLTGTVIVAKLLRRFSFRNCFGLGFLMSSKGLVELILLNIALSKKVITEELFAILVSMALILVSMATPMIMWLYKPARDVPPYKRRNLQAKKVANNKLSLLLCLHGVRNIPGMMNLVQMTKGKNPKILQVNALHLVEFSERSSAIIRLAQAGLPTEDGADSMDDAPINEDAVGMSLRTFGRMNNFKIRVTLSMSGLDRMHEDVCSAAANCRANIIILPFHKSPRPDGSLESMGQGLLHVNFNVIKESPCSVAILVDRGLGSAEKESPLRNAHNVLVLFFGGPDDREALLFGQTMREHGGVHLTVVQCVLKRPTTLARLCTDDLAKYLPPASDQKFKRCKDVLLRWRDRSGDRLQALRKLAREAYGGHPPSAAEEAEQRRNESEPDYCVEVGVTKLELENEKKLDIKVLGPLLAAAKQQSQDVAGSKVERLTVQVIEISDNPKEAIETLLLKGGYDLIMTGLHLSPECAVQRAGTFCSGNDQGLGPVGNLLVSKEMRSISSSSILVVRQHCPGFDESLGGMSDLKAVDQKATAPEPKRILPASSELKPAAGDEILTGDATRVPRRD